MSGSGLRFGLNIPKSKKPLKNQPAKPLLFSDAPEDPEDVQTSSVTLVHQNDPSRSASFTKNASKNAISEEIKRKALEEDPLLFDYDATMAAMDAKRKRATQGPSSDQVATAFDYFIFILIYFSQNI